MSKRKRKRDQVRSPAGTHQAATTEKHSHHEEGFESLRAARPHILKLLARTQHLNDLIDHAFGGRLFLPNLAPDAPANMRRANAYISQRRRVLKLTGKALELWMTSFGLRPEENWIPLLVEEMRQKGSQRSG